MRRPPPFRGQTAQVVNIPAPVRGLNTRDAVVPDQNPLFATYLVNWFPGSSSVDVRGGFQGLAVTGTNTNYDGVTQLMVYQSGTTQTLFSILDKSTATVGTRFQPGPQDYNNVRYNNGHENWVNFGNSGGQYLVLAAEGTASASGGGPRYYDGATWTVPAITGPTDKGNLTGIAVHRNRLWFIEEGTLNLWYLPTNALAGAAIKFPLTSVFSKGGKIVAIQTWTVDGGVGGTDDLFVVMTTSGQIAVYQGTDPASATTWQIIGIFNVSRPMFASTIANQRANCHLLYKYGTDVLAILEDGVYSMKQILQGNEGSQYAITDVIRPSIISAAATFGPEAAFNANWQLGYCSRYGLIILGYVTGSSSVTGRGSAYFVMNSVTGAWTTFDVSGIGVLAQSVTIFKGNLYLGGGPGIGATTENAWQYSGPTVGFDVGAGGSPSVAIPTFGIAAPSGFGSAKNKLCVGVRPNISVVAGLQVIAGTGRGVNNEGSGGYRTYAAAYTYITDWYSVASRPINTVGPLLAVNGGTSGTFCSWTSTDMLLQQGGAL